MHTQVKDNVKARSLDEEDLLNGEERWQESMKRVVKSLI